MGNNSEERINILSLREKIRTGLSEINYGGNWLEEYDSWRQKDSNRFDSLLVITNPFDLANCGDRQIFDLTNQDDALDLDVICMSVFLSEHLLHHAKLAFASVKNERTRAKKLDTIERYNNLVKTIIDSPNLSGCIVTLHSFAEKQIVLFGARSIDIYACFFSLKENLRKRSPESLYLLFTLWRISRTEIAFKTLLSSVIDYIQTYYYDYDNDPDMHLFCTPENKSAIKNLESIIHWLKLISFHTNGIFEKYKEMDWLRPVDQLADNIIETNQISRFNMFLYKKCFPSDDDKMVQTKAICNHGYAIWIKTVDVMYIVCDILQSLYDYPESDLEMMGTAKDYILTLYDNMIKIRDYYTRIVFFHQAYYQLERHYYDSAVTNALEEDAERISESFDDVLSFVDAIAADDIPNLLQAKQKYIKGLSGFISEEQEKQLDKLTICVTDKIKESIQKKDVYDQLYSAVSQEFLPFMAALKQHPQIFCSLASAEYLYKQYAETVQLGYDFDYSCISIMYYMSLEDFLNKLIYIPYARNVLSNINQTQINDRNWQKNGAKDYVSQFTSFWNFVKSTSSYRLKQSCEIGVLGYLLEGISSEKQLRNFVTQEFPNVDIQRIHAFGKRLKIIAPRRNDAAHGGNYLTYNDVCTDKQNVYDTSGAAFKGMILELMGILF